MPIEPTNYGPGLPAVRVPGGYFGSRNRFDAAFDRVLIAVFTPIGTRPNARQFGSRLAQLLFLPQTVETAVLCRTVVTDAVQTWVQDVVVRSVNVALDGERIKFDLTFSLRGDPVETTRYTFIQKSSLLRLVGSGEA